MLPLETIAWKHPAKMIIVNDIHYDNLETFQPEKVSGIQHL